jgi:uncharacterized membrane protein
MSSTILAPLLAAPAPVQLHAAAGVLALVLGVARLAWAQEERTERSLGWGFLGFLMLSAVSALFLSPPHGALSLFGLTPHHGFAILALAGSCAAVVAARQGRRLGRQRIVTATFVGVFLMAGLFEMAPGRMLHTVLAGS